MAGVTKLANPFPIYLDLQGRPLDAGYIYVGTVGSDPEAEENRLALFWNKERTQAADQPLRTIGGFVVNGANVASVFFAETDHSLTVKDLNGELVAYSPSIADAAGAQFQPLDSDLTAIAALATTAYGRGLLTLAGQAALQAAVGISAGLPLAGGTVTGNIVRSGGGPHIYHGNAALTSGKITVSLASGGNPTSAPGEIWLGTSS